MLFLLDSMRFFPGIMFNGIISAVRQWRPIGPIRSNVRSHQPSECCHHRQEERGEAAYSHRPGRCDKGTSALLALIGSSCAALIEGIR